MVESHNAEVAERVKRVQRVLDDCLRRRAAGETWSDADVITEHAELMPELEERLGALKLIEQAGRQAEDGSSAAVSLPADHIQGSCPQCEAKWRAGAEHAGRKVRCRKCGHVFAVEAGSSLMGVGGHSESEPSSAGVLDSIPGYEIEGELGHGGMGCVYRAHELATKRTVALKVMLTDATPTSGSGGGLNVRWRSPRRCSIRTSPGCMPRGYTKGSTGSRWSTSRVCRWTCMWSVSIRR